MQTFAVISTMPQHADLERVVRSVYVNAHQDVGSNVWLVADRNVTAFEVAQKLGVQTNERSGLDNVVVLQFGGYWGHAPGAIWSWIGEKLVTD